MYCFFIAAGTTSACLVTKYISDVVFSLTVFTRMSEQFRNVCNAIFQDALTTAAYGCLHAQWLCWPPLPKSGPDSNSAETDSQPWRWFSTTAGSVACAMQKALYSWSSDTQAALAKWLLPTAHAPCFPIGGMIDYLADHEDSQSTCCAQEFRAVVSC